MPQALRQDRCSLYCTSTSLSKTPILEAKEEEGFVHGGPMPDHDFRRVPESSRDRSSNGNLNYKNLCTEICKCFQIASMLSERFSFAARLRMQGPKLNVPFEGSASNVLYGFTFINHGTIEDFKERMSLSMVARAVPCPSHSITWLLTTMLFCFPSR